MAARADAPATRPDLAPSRDEYIIVPNVGGNSDIGVLLGVAGSYVWFREGYYPYRARLNALASASFKYDLRGLRAVQQFHTLQLDQPHFLSRRLRLEARTDFFRAVDYSWFGIGNATTIEPRPPPPDAASAYEYVQEHVRLSALLRIKTVAPFDVAIFSHTRYAFPEPYPSSKLAEDLAAGAVIGGKAALLQTVAAGFMVDTRDSEFMPTRGIFYKVGVGGTIGSEERVRFGETSATLTHFARLGGPFIFASRMIGSVKFGEVPFYELQQGDVFNPQYLVGGFGGVRGVRLGRYAGLVKAISNTEIRMIPFPRFRAFRRSILPGMIAFFDAGRVWSDFESRPSADGRKLGLKCGVGGGVFFQLDEAALIRIEAAYSNDESGRDFPVSIYFQSGFHY